MFRTDSGGPAFPRTGFTPDMTDAGGDRLRELMGTITEPQSGMTLFDFYVGQALQGLLANSGTFGRGLPPLERAEAQAMVEQLGGAAVLYAHATMIAREKYLALPKPPKVHDPEDEG